MTPTDVDRTRLGLVRALRLVREVDRRLHEFDFDRDVVENLTMGLITAEEFRDATEWPTGTGAQVVLRDALGLYPPLPREEVEVLEEKLNENGWTRVSVRHRPTGIPVCSRAIDSGVAHEIADLMLAREVGSQAIALVERRREADQRRRQLLDRLVAGEVTPDQVMDWIDRQREASDTQQMVADGLGADPVVAQQLLDGLMSIDTVVQEHREAVLAALVTERTTTGAPQRCPACDMDLTDLWEMRSPDERGEYRCFGGFVVYEQTTAWQGTEPLASPVPIIGHTYHCGTAVSPRI